MSPELAIGDTLDSQTQLFLNFLLDSIILNLG